jgi:hypothetical protein
MISADMQAYTKLLHDSVIAVSKQNQEAELTPPIPWLATPALNINADSNKAARTSVTQ